MKKKKSAKVLSKKELKKLAKNYPRWKLDAKQTKLTQTFVFPQHIDALIFIARMTVNAEILKHHPHVTFTHLTVKVVLTTQEIKALTKQDLELLKRIEFIHDTQKVDKD